MADSAASNQFPEKTRALLQEMWERNLPIIHDRLKLLEEAANAEPLPDKLRIEAMNIAHKLAGSLGMFGFAEGTRLARQLELALDVPAPDLTQVALLTRQLREVLFPPSSLSPAAP
jgi:HPt (histidine-containing phosphotransfer) domain-containing protein